MKSFLISLLFASILTACSTNKKFTTRKYMKGRYTSDVANKQKTESKSKSIKVAYVTTNVATTVTSKGTSDLSSVTNAHLPNSQNKEPFTQTTNLITEKKKNFDFVKNERVRNDEMRLILASNNVALEDDKETTKDGESNTAGQKSIISVFLSAGGFTLDALAFILAVSTLQYFFLIFSLIGLTLGIIGMILGLQGVREFRTEKNDGNTKPSILVNGIIGAAIGLAAIIGAVYFGIFGALIILTTF